MAHSRLDLNSGDEPVADDRQPAYEKKSFYCPHPSCEAFANMKWRPLRFQTGTTHKPSGVNSAWCSACNLYSLWVGERMIFPSATREGATPNLDMPEQVLAVYEEAREVAPISRKSAAALLRLALQMLIDDLVEGKGDINTKIGKLVTLGVDERITKSMDTIRVCGNEAVHPGKIDLDNDDDVLPGLFALINIVTEQVVTRRKQIDSLYDKLPQRKLDGIKDRDAKKANTPPSDAGQ